MGLEYSQIQSTIPILLCANTNRGNAVKRPPDPEHMANYVCSLFPDNDIRLNEEIEETQTHM